MSNRFGSCIELFCKRRKILSIYDFMVGRAIGLGPVSVPAICTWKWTRRIQHFSLTGWHAIVLIEWMEFSQRKLTHKASAITKVIKHFWASWRIGTEITLRHEPWVLTRRLHSDFVWIIPCPQPESLITMSQNRERAGDYATTARRTEKRFIEKTICD